MESPVGRALSGIPALGEHQGHPYLPARRPSLTLPGFGERALATSVRHGALSEKMTDPSSQWVICAYLSENWDPRNGCFPSGPENLMATSTKTHLRTHLRAPRPERFAWPHPVGVIGAGLSRGQRNFPPPNMCKHPRCSGSPSMPPFSGQQKPMCLHLFWEASLHLDSAFL